ARRRDGHYFWMADLAHRAAGVQFAAGQRAGLGGGDGYRGFGGHRAVLRNLAREQGGAPGSGGGVALRVAHCPADCARPSSTRPSTIVATRGLGATAESPKAQTHWLGSVKMHLAATIFWFLWSLE